MTKPKHAGGRPRRRPFAAHDARAVTIRARNARSYLRQLHWCLEGHPDVLNHWLETRPQDVAWWLKVEPAVMDVLGRLLATIDSPVAKGEGHGDG